MNTLTKHLRFPPGMFVLSLLFACFCATAQDDVGFVSIFDGKTLEVGVPIQRAMPQRGL